LYKAKLGEKLHEALAAVLPILAIVLTLSLTIAPMPSGVVMGFFMGGLMLVVGMMFFTLGAELAMEPIGEKMGSRLTQTKNLPLILGVSFALGLMITISEPDLQVLANQVPSIPNMTLILAVAFGVGLFLVVAVARMVFSVPLNALLVGLYLAVFGLAMLVPEDFLAVAFDSGGVTTGPMTVPFIMAFGLGISAIRSDKHAANDSFGLVALCSVGPILAVMLLGLIFQPDGAEYAAAVIQEPETTKVLANMFLHALPHYLEEIGIALAPIIIFFLVFQVVLLKLEKRTMIRILVGLLYTYVGLSLFLTGVNVGFSPAGTYLGRTLSGLEFNWIIVPLGMLIGYFIVKAEPAIYVLMRQVEEITDGAIPGTALQTSLCLGVAVSVGLAMLRVLYGIPVMTFLIPGYAIAILLSFVVPRIFTAIAFDSGGVASGPMTATFLLPFAIGACETVGGNVVADAFGVVAMVAMTPLITIQILGVAYRIRTRTRVAEPVAAGLGEYDIIEL